MENLIEIEVINIESTHEGNFAYISYRDERFSDGANDGYNCIRVPLNLRPIQRSSRDNILCDQSIKDYTVAESSSNSK